MSLQLEIEKLKGPENYFQWAMILTAYLESEDLWRFVENGPGITHESHLKDKRAQFIIMCHIDKKFFKSWPTDVSSARDIWAYLDDKCSMRFLY